MVLRSGTNIIVSAALFQIGTGYSVVIAGLDPAIHRLCKRMDARVKPAHDEEGESRQHDAHVDQVNEPPRLFLHKLFECAVTAAHPANCLIPHLPPPLSGRLIILAAGKAAGSMVEVAERHYRGDCNFPPERLEGLAVTRRGYARPTAIVPVIEAGHPVPDAAGLNATSNVLSLAQAAGPDDLVLVLISGGASANWIAPLPGLSLAEKQAVTRSLIGSGASISEINAVRKHLSQIKGGRLTVRAHPARVATIAISDVVGDDPSVIGSGPTVPDPTTRADALAAAERHQVTLSAAVRRALEEPANETPKPGDPIFASSSFALAMRPHEAFDRVAARVRAAGYECILLGAGLEGEAREVAAEHAALVHELQRQRRHALILSGGELTVTVRGNGRGGPNQEYALALLQALRDMRGVAAIAADTDGTDGGRGESDDPAGALIDSGTAARALALGLDPAAFLNDNNSTEFFAQVGGLVTPGPTHTNINDFRAILIDSA
jgi:hydroxypyruvate reductase